MNREWIKERPKVYTFLRELLIEMGDSEEIPEFGK